MRDSGFPDCRARTIRNSRCHHEQLARLPRQAPDGGQKEHRRQQQQRQEAGEFADRAASAQGKLAESIARCAGLLALPSRCSAPPLPRTLSGLACAYFLCVLARSLSFVHESAAHRRPTSDSNEWCRRRRRRCCCCCVVREWPDSAGGAGCALAGAPLPLAPPLLPRRLCFHALAKARS